MPDKKQAASPSGAGPESLPEERPILSGGECGPAGPDDPLAITEIELEEVSIDGICGVY